MGDRGNFRKIKHVLEECMSDQQWHTSPEIEKRCEEEGIHLNGDRSSIYSIFFQMKKRGNIITDGRGMYKLTGPLSENNKNNEQKQGVLSSDEELITAVGIIEKYLIKYKNFSLMDCSDAELQKAKSNVKMLNNLLKGIAKDTAAIQYSDKEIENG